ncbi:hypothetical protein LguiB_023378 [Lonicera macranthoides]
MKEEPSLEGNSGLYKRSKENPFAEGFFTDPIGKLNIKETSEFVKALPMPNNGGAESSGGFMTKRNNIEAPCTPGRPIFSFSSSSSSVGNLSRSRKHFPSKWDDAEKWLIGSSSPAHHPALKPSAESSKVYKRCINNGFKPQQARVFDQNSSVVVTEEKVSSLQGHNPLDSTDVLLTDKFTNEMEVEPKFPKSFLEPAKEGLLLGKSTQNSMRDAATEVVHEVKHRDIGTEMTPLGSSTTSRCHTPFKTSSPARHNTPADRSGPLAFASTTIDITQLQDCHLAKLQLGAQFRSVTSNWSSKEEEEENISKSLRHYDITNEYRKSFSDFRPCCAWEEEKTKCCLRYQREEAKIQAWVNLQNAKAEAQSRNLEVKIEKMRSKLEGKLMNKMGIVHRKAEEMRAAALVQHSGQAKGSITTNIKNSGSSARSSSSSCGCFPACNIHHHHRHQHH